VALLLLLVVARIAAEAIERVKQPGMIGEIAALTNYGRLSK
jgi:Kef-type K+ transport system membrane component KefB